MTSLEASWKGKDRQTSCGSLWRARSLRLAGVLGDQEESVEKAPPLP